MSASNKKKLRSEQRAAALTEKQLKEQQEAKKLKTLTLTFVVAMVLVVAILIGVSVTPTIVGTVRRNSHAVTIGDHELSAAQLTYFYIDAISEYQNNVYQSYYSYYGDYWYLGLGFDTTAPLNKQVYDEKTGDSWADYFIDTAIENATSVFALYEDAMAKNYKLSDEEQKDLDKALNSLEDNAKAMNYNSLNHYLRSVYGSSATVKSYEEYYTISTIATSYYNDHSDSLEYTVEDYRAHDKDKFNNYSSFDYIYYTLNYSSYLKEVDAKKDETTGQLTWTDEQKDAARAQAKADMEALLAAGIKDKETFDKAVQALEINKYDKDGKPVEDSKKATATEALDRLYTTINIDTAAKEWLGHEDRQPGDLSSFPINAYITEKDEKVPEDHVHSDTCGHKKVTNSYYVVLYLDKDTNETHLVNVRHVLVKFKGGKTDSTTGNVTYSVAEKEAAKTEAEKLLKDWKESIANEKDAAKIEESFGALANKESDDQGGKVTNGGLYEDIYPGQMVEAFEKWCFDKERQPGDTGLVETEYGYHIMFYSSTDEMTYRDMMIKSELLEEDMEEWHDGLTEAVKVTVVNLKHMEHDLIVG